MPTYTIDGPDGKTYSIDGPDGASRDQVIAKIKEKQGGELPGIMATAGDMATSFGRGVAKGAIGLAGLPGDVSNLVGEGVEKGGEALGLAPRPIPASPGLPDTGKITKAVEGVTGDFGSPKTTAGKYAESVGEFVPSAAIGPGGLATKAATTVAGGLGAEAGGELAGEPGRFIGGLVGGGAAGAASAEAQGARLSARLPDTDAIKASSKAGYKAIENARMTMKLPAVSAFTTQARAQLENQLIDELEAPAVFRALDHFNKGDGGVATLMALYENLGKISPAAGTKYAAAGIVRNEIGDFIDKLQPQDLTTGDAAFTKTMWDHAKASWRSYRKVEQVERAAEKGENVAATTGTGANKQNALRQKIRTILDSDFKSRGFSQATKDKMEEIVTGTWASNVARYIGKFAPSGPVSSWATILTGLEAGVPAGAAVGIGATLAKHLGTYLTRRQIRELEDIIRAESPIGKPVAAANAAQAPNRAAIVPAAALRSELATSASSPLAGNQ